ncbi:MAG: DUF2062 domain-containing protein [Candidatus Manganitrophaceae bacterium]
MGFLPNLKEQVRRVLGLSDTPQRTAFAFAFGVFIAFSPLLGFHFFLAIFSAWFFRLNRLAILFGALVNNPWTFTPITLASTWFGIELCCKANEIPPIDFEGLSLVNMTVQLKSYFLPFVIGSTLMGLVFSVVAYFGMLWMIFQYRKTRRPESPESG